MRDHSVRITLTGSLSKASACLSLQPVAWMAQDDVSNSDTIQSIDSSGGRRTEYLLFDGDHVEELKGYVRWTG
jgi:hypothetical protein